MSSNFSEKLQQYTQTLRELIENYKWTSDREEIGFVITNSDGIVNISGMKSCKVNEILEIDGSMLALASTLRPNIIGAIMLSDYDKVKEGMKVVRTGRIFSAPQGDSLLGRVINVFGKPIDEAGVLKETQWSEAECPAPGVMERKSVDQPLYTGILAVDSLIPIGKGQRELIIGDRQTGKTSLAIDTIINQKGKDCCCVYVSIGQKNSSIAQLIEKLKVNDAMSYTTFVVASASDLPSLQFLAPFVGVTVAEYWMRRNKDVLIIYDDLSQHAIAYRTLSLLLSLPPGREAFPGDIFFLHSRLLERAGRLSLEAGGGSITALPIIQTQADDIAAYIPSNVISITDGQIFLKTALFNAGQKPAVDVTLSVSRVGGAAQQKAIKSMSSTLKLELAQYFELVEFSRFGSDVNPTTKNILDLGARIQKILIQKNFAPFSPQDELLLLYIIKQKYILQIKELNQVPLFVEKILKAWKAMPLYNEIDLTKNVSDNDLMLLNGLIEQNISFFNN